jgi:hypothetical protein
MDDKFSKLRFGEFAKAAAAGAIIGAVALQPTGAQAATGAVQILTTGPGGLKAIWFVNTNITFSTTSSGSLAMSSASLHTAAAATGNSFNRNDAFDGALSWHVYTSPPGGADESGGYFKAGGVVSVTANSVVGPSKTLAGLTTHAELHFSSSRNVVRSMFFLQNPTGAPITVTVDADSNLGSDSNTSIQATSSGDATFDSSDNWVISCQGASGPGSACDLTRDPIITLAFQGPGGIRAGSAGAIFANGNDNPNFRWSGITVPAGETRAVMVFAELSDTVADAEADAAVFNANSTLQATDYLAGLTPLQQSEVVNFIVSPTPVPTLTQWALAGMAGLLGIAGVVRAGLFGRRRRRAAARTVAGLALGLLALGMGAPSAFATPVGQTCAAELRQMCGNQTGHALHQCRAAHRGNFSAACTQALAVSGKKLKDVKPETR